MTLRSVVTPACILLTSGITALFFANSHGNRNMTMGSHDQVAQQACNPSIQRCCFNPDGTPAPPGTRRGPYTCLPNGTWG